MLSNAETILALVSLFLKARGGSHRISDNGLDSGPKYSRGSDIFGKCFTGPQDIENLVLRVACDGELQRINQMLWFRIGSNVDLID